MTPATHHQVTNPLSYRKQTIAKQFGQAKQYQAHASVQARICDKLIEAVINTEQSHVLEVGAGQGQLTKELLNRLTAHSFFINELSNTNRHLLTKLIKNSRIDTQKVVLNIGDGEHLTLDESCSLIISANTIQWFDDPLSFINQSANNLKRGGQLLFNTFTPNNFYQIKQLTGQGLHYPSKKEWITRLEDCGFALNNVDILTFDLELTSPLQVLKHIKSTGVSVSQVNDSSFLWNKTSLKKFCEDYKLLFSAGSAPNPQSVKLTYEALLISASKL